MARVLPGLMLESPAAPFMHSLSGGAFSVRPGAVSSIPSPPSLALARGIRASACTKWQRTIGECLCTSRQMAAIQSCRPRRLEQGSKGGDSWSSLSACVGCPLGLAGAGAGSAEAGRGRVWGFGLARALRSAYALSSEGTATVSGTGFSFQGMQNPGKGRLGLSARAKRSSRSSSGSDGGEEDGDTSLPADVAAYNALIEAHGEAGEPGKAVQLAEEMAARGVVPTVATYAALLAACAQAKWRKEAERYFLDTWAALGAAPGAAEWGHMMGMWVLLDSRDEGVRWLHHMVHQGCVPDVATYELLLAASLAGCMLPEAEAVLDLMLEGRARARAERALAEGRSALGERGWAPEPVWEREWAAGWAADPPYGDLFDAYGALLHALAVSETPKERVIILNMMERTGLPPHGLVNRLLREPPPAGTPLPGAPRAGAAAAAAVEEEADRKLWAEVEAYAASYQDLLTEGERRWFEASFVSLLWATGWRRRAASLWALAARSHDGAASSLSPFALRPEVSTAGGSSVRSLDLRGIPAAAAAAVVTAELASLRQLAALPEGQDQGFPDVLELVLGARQETESEGEAEGEGEGEGEALAEAQAQAEEGTKEEAEEIAQQVAAAVAGGALFTEDPARLGRLRVEGSALRLWLRTREAGGALQLADAPAWSLEAEAGLLATLDARGRRLHPALLNHDVGRRAPGGDRRPLPRDVIEQLLLAEARPRPDLEEGGDPDQEEPLTPEERRRRGLMPWGSYARPMYTDYVRWPERRPQPKGGAAAGAGGSSASSSSSSSS